ncbi:hypothetical protein BZG36_03805 [Bifiguratus adelaidae]|uniref:U3 small nucleolar RNA-associated protein 18 homolog n=1 Tax=Bifiguratus adelaidae TaxID=1938954 RepID=A0A261XWY4_9FUNG|nr:hypothetical protein BZG36_03805 [Bifiguratus adelaidae]
MSEADLEALVFGRGRREAEEGSEDGFERDLIVEDESDVGEPEGPLDDFFFLDSGPGGLAVDGKKDDKVSKNEEDEEEESDVGEEESTSSGSEDESEAESENAKGMDFGYGRPPAWQDPDDATTQVSIASVKRSRKLRETEEEDVISGLEYERRLREQYMARHKRLNPTPKWATLPSQLKKRKVTRYSDADSDYSDEEPIVDTDDMLLSTESILQDRKQVLALPSDRLDVTRVKNANQSSVHQSVVTSVSWHPSGNVLMTSGLDKTMKLFQIDGRVNPKIQSVLYKDMPIHKSCFHPTGSAVISTGRRKYYYIFDVESGRVQKCSGIRGRDTDKSLENFSVSPCGRYMAFLGRDGYIVLVSYETRQWIANLKMNGSVRSVDWSEDGEKLYSVGGDAEVYEWDIGTRACVARWPDFGGFKPTAIARGKGGHDYAAIGSRSGIVNLYSSPTSDTPKPTKVIMNLTTSIHDLTFNHDSSILALASRAKKDQLRLLHVPSRSVFSNWPTQGTPLSFVNCLAFSPYSGYLSIGNDKGKVLLYRLNHYPRA